MSHVRGLSTDTARCRACDVMVVFLIAWVMTACCDFVLSAIQAFLINDYHAHPLYRAYQDMHMY